MKLVINKCYGGFGVSIAAMKEMAGKCEHVKANEPIEFYGSKKEWEKAINESNIDRDYMYFDENNWPVYDHHRNDSRNCPVLVATVQKMGAAASGRFAELEIVDIPDGVAYEIDEYDGIEHIAEKHRTWG